MLTVSCLPGVPAAGRAEMRSCGMCVTDPAAASKGKGLAQHRFARIVAIGMVLFVCFFSFLKQMSSAVASARWSIPNFWWSGINVLFSWHLSLFRGIFVMWHSSLSRPQPLAYAHLISCFSLDAHKTISAAPVLWPFIFVTRTARGNENCVTISPLPQCLGQVW